MLDATQILKDVLEYDTVTASWYLRCTLVGTASSSIGKDADWQQILQSVYDPVTHSLRVVEL